MKVFIDSSVLVAALLSPEGGSAKILELCELGIIKGFISKDVVQEIEEVIQRKFPEASAHCKKILKKSKLKIIQKINPTVLSLAKHWISHPKDVKILAAAKSMKADYLITLDIRHFIKDEKVSKKSKMAIFTPGDFLTMLRKIKEFN